MSVQYGGETMISIPSVGTCPLLNHAFLLLVKQVNKFGLHLSLAQWGFESVAFPHSEINGKSFSGPFHPHTH